MSDDFLEGDDDLTGGESSAPDSGKRKVGFLPAIVLQIFKWVAIVLGMIIFVVTIVIVTLQVIGGVGPGGPRTTITEDYVESLPMFDYFELAELRGVTADEVRNTYVVTIQIGYRVGDAATANEIILRRVQITDQILLWFSSQNAAYLMNSQNREEIRSRLKALINQIMTRQIQEVRFTNFQVLNF